MGESGRDSGARGSGARPPESLLLSVEHLTSGFDLKRRFLPAVIDVSFDAIADAGQRARFMNLPTSFVLEEEAVDRLREVAGRLLRQSPDYQELLEQIGFP